jgi:hypothetical protein
MGKLVSVVSIEEPTAYYGSNSTAYVHYSDNHGTYVRTDTYPGYSSCTRARNIPMVPLYHIRYLVVCVRVRVRNGTLAMVRTMVLPGVPWS